MLPLLPCPAASRCRGAAAARPGRESASMPRDSRNSVAESSSSPAPSSSSSSLGRWSGRVNSTSSLRSAARSPEVEGVTSADSSWQPARPAARKSTVKLGPRR